jgi:hypothetical protein
MQKVVTPVEASPVRGTRVPQVAAMAPAGWVVR